MSCSVNKRVTGLNIFEKQYMLYPLLEVTQSILSYKGLWKRSDARNNFSVSSQISLSHLMLVSFSWASLVAQTVKNLPVTWKTWVWSLGWEDPLEKDMAPHSSTLAWRIPWMEEPGRLQSMRSRRVGHDWVTSLSAYSLYSFKYRICLLTSITRVG